jgi:hypothetical protein
MYRYIIRNSINTGVGGQHYDPAVLPPGKCSSTQVAESERAFGPMWRPGNFLGPTGGGNQKTPLHSESPYQLSYPVPFPIS